MNKYHAQPTVVDGVRYASKKEGKRAWELEQARKSGEVRWWCRQPRFVLPGGVEYVADFIVAWKDGTVEIEEVKGFWTANAKTKVKIAEAVYGIEVVEL